MPTNASIIVSIDEDITVSVARLFKQRFELGMFDPAEIQPYKQISSDVVDSPEHRQLALEVYSMFFCIENSLNQILHVPSIYISLTTKGCKTNNGTIEK